MSKNNEDYLKSVKRDLTINNIVTILLGILIIAGVLSLTSADPTLDDLENKIGLAMILSVGLYGMLLFCQMNLGIEFKYLCRRQETLMRILFYECPAWKDDFENPYFWEDHEDEGSEKNEDGNNTS